MEFTATIDRKRVYDLVIAGLECGSMASIGVTTAKSYSEALDKLDAGEANAFEGVLAYDHAAHVEGYEPAGEPTYLTDEVLAKALKLMAEKHSRHYGDFIAENEDAITGDLFLQLAVLGSVVYG